METLGAQICPSMEHSEVRTLKEVIEPNDKQAELDLPKGTKSEATFRT